VVSLAAQVLEAGKTPDTGDLTTIDFGKYTQVGMFQIAEGAVGSKTVDMIEEGRQEIGVIIPYYDPRTQQQAEITIPERDFLRTGLGIGGGLVTFHGEGVNREYAWLIENPKHADQAALFFFHPHPKKEVDGVQAVLNNQPEPTSAHVVERFFTNTSGHFRNDPNKSPLQEAAETEYDEEKRAKRLIGVPAQQAIFEFMTIAAARLGEGEGRALEAMLPGIFESPAGEFYQEHVKNRRVDLTDEMKRVIVRSKPAEREPEPAPVRIEPEDDPGRGLGLETKQGVALWDFGHTKEVAIDFAYGTDDNTAGVLTSYMRRILTTMNNAKSVDAFQDIERLLDELSQTHFASSTSLPIPEVETINYLDKNILFSDNTGKSRRYVYAATTIGEWTKHARLKQREMNDLGQIHEPVDLSNSPMADGHTPAD
jgi:hypothetical protein